MRKIVILALFVSGCVSLTACATTETAGAAPAGATAARDPDGPPYPDLTPPWLNPAVGTENRDAKR